MSEGIRELKTLMLESGTLRTTQPGSARKVWAVVSGIAAILGGDQAETVESFYRLDGGRPYKALTVEQFAAQRADAVRLAAADAYAASILNETINPALSDAARTVESIQAAFAVAVTVTP